MPTSTVQGEEGRGYYFCSVPRPKMYAFVQKHDPQQRHFYEVTPLHGALRPFFDIEWDPPQAFDVSVVVQTLLVETKRAASTLVPSETLSCEHLLMTASSAAKASFHLHVHLRTGEGRAVALDGMGNLARFCLRVLARVFAKLGCIAPHALPVDPSVYTKFRVLRLPGCVKRKHASLSEWRQRVLRPLSMEVRGGHSSDLLRQKPPALPQTTFEWALVTLEDAEPSKTLLLRDNTHSDLSRFVPKGRTGRSSAYTRAYSGAAEPDAPPPVMGPGGQAEAAAQHLELSVLARAGDAVDGRSEATHFDLLTTGSKHFRVQDEGALHALMWSWHQAGRAFVAHELLDRQQESAPLVLDIDRLPVPLLGSVLEAAVAAVRWVFGLDAHPLCVVLTAGASSAHLHFPEIGIRQSSPADTGMAFACLRRALHERLPVLNWQLLLDAGPYSCGSLRMLGASKLRGGFAERPLELCGVLPRGGGALSHSEGFVWALQHTSLRRSVPARDVCAAARHWFFGRGFAVDGGLMPPPRREASWCLLGAVVDAARSAAGMALQRDGATDVGASRPEFAALLAFVEAVFPELWKHVCVRKVRVQRGASGTFYRVRLQSSFCSIARRSHAKSQGGALFVTSWGRAVLRCFVCQGRGVPPTSRAFSPGSSVLDVLFPHRRRKLPETVSILVEAARGSAELLPDALALVCGDARDRVLGLSDELYAEATTGGAARGLSGKKRGRPRAPPPPPAVGPSETVPLPDAVRDSLFTLLDALQAGDWFGFPAERRISSSMLYDVLLLREQRRGARVDVDGRNAFAFLQVATSASRGTLRTKARQVDALLRSERKLVASRIRAHETDAPGGQQALEWGEALLQIDGLLVRLEKEVFPLAEDTNMYYVYKLCCENGVRWIAPRNVNVAALVLSYLKLCIDRGEFARQPVAKRLGHGNFACNIMRFDRARFVYQVCFRDTDSFVAFLLRDAPFVRDLLRSKQQLGDHISDSLVKESFWESTEPDLRFSAFANGLYCIEEHRLYLSDDAEFERRRLAARGGAGAGADFAARFGRLSELSGAGSARVCAGNAFPLPMRVPDVEWRVGDPAAASFQGMRIEWAAPLESDMQKIVRFQNWDLGTEFVFWALVGRLLRRLNVQVTAPGHTESKWLPRDSLKSLLFLVGESDAGKTAIAHIVRFFFQPQYVAELEAQVEERFPLAGCVNAALVIVGEGKDFNLNEDTLCKISEGLRCAVHRKNLPPLHVLFQAPMLVTGNGKFPHKDAKCQISNRTVYFPFTHAVDPRSQDLGLVHRVCTEQIDIVLRKANSAYLLLLRLLRGRNLFSLVHPQSTLAQERKINSVRALREFIAACCSHQPLQNLALKCDDGARICFPRSVQHSLGLGVPPEGAVPTGAPPRVALPDVVGAFRRFAQHKRNIKAALPEFASTGSLDALAVARSAWWRHFGVVLAAAESGGREGVLLLHGLQLNSRVAHSASKAPPASDTFFAGSAQ